MSYQVHNFQTGDIIEAAPVNEMDIQIQANEQAISSKLSSSLKGAANGLAELDSNGIVPSAQLPSYVDDVLEYDTMSAFPETGESGKIYIAKNTNLTYRWGGSSYVEISKSLALGETSSTAYRGDRGAAAFKHGVTNKGSAFSQGLYKITTNIEGHVTNAIAVTKNDITALGIPGENTTYVFDGAYNAETNKAATVSTATNLINSLNGGTIGTPGRGKTVTALSQSGGNISATFGNILITKSQVSDFPTIGDAAEKGVTDNNTPTDVTSSDTNLITGRTLYNAGYTKNTGTITGITMNGESKGTSGVVDLGSVATLGLDGKVPSSQLPDNTDIALKADKVTSATSGNFAGLDNNGNLTDSGHSAADFMPINVAITPTINTSNLSLGTNDCCAVGSIVFVSIRCSTVANITARAYIGITLPKPLNRGNLASSASVCHASNNVDISATLLADGRIFTTAAIASGTNLTFTFSYPSTSEEIASFISS